MTSLSSLFLDRRKIVEEGVDIVSAFVLLTRIAGEISGGLTIHLKERNDLCNQIADRSFALQDCSRKKKMQ